MAPKKLVKNLSARTKATAPPARKSVSTSKKPAPKSSSRGSKQDSKAEFPAVFAGLRAILKPFEPRMVVVKDDETWYYLDTKLIGRNKKPVMFSAVRLGKAYVSFHLMTVYCNPKFVAGMSPELKGRMQGKACFNFTRVDEPCFAELAALARAGAEWFESGKLDKMVGNCD